MPDLSQWPTTPNDKTVRRTYDADRQLPGRDPPGGPRRTPCPAPGAGGRLRRDAEIALLGGLATPFG
ncbi:MAG: hypothetical protein U0841_07195 [Chloroflexia bacterium]